MSFCLLYLSSFTYLFISTEDPVNSKQILFTAGMVGDYSGLSTLYLIFLGVSLQNHFRSHIKLGTNHYFSNGGVPDLVKKIVCR